MSEFDLFEEQIEKDRRARVAAAREANAAAIRLEAEQAAIRKEKARLFTLETNERHRLAEYRYHGVEPPVIDGVPTKSSFHMLTSLGWTIEDMLGQKQMVRPFAPPVHERRTRDQYDQNT